VLDQHRLVDHHTVYLLLIRIDQDMHAVAELQLGLHRPRPLSQPTEAHYPPLFWAKNHVSRPSSNHQNTPFICSAGAARRLDFLFILL
jgi:hypothetical protein